MNTKEIAFCHTCKEHKLCAFSEVVDWEAYGETVDKQHYCDDCKEAVLRDRRAMWSEEWINGGGDIRELSEVSKEIRNFPTESLARKRDEFVNGLINWSDLANVKTPIMNNLTDKQMQNWIMTCLIVEELRERGMEYVGMGENKHE